MVTLINKFTVHGDTAEFEKVWAASSEFMRAQQGFVNFKLHRSLNRPDSYVNIALWETVEDHHRVLASPEFAVHIKELAALATPEPDLYVVVLEGTPAK
ncbi:antibiotic biosynthesis monooxygenase family protein [Kitasatospora sp. NPDC087314]|uniref:antibiotic biosynthesis monooxygenase family protein n=1 Tax=Kitasatospora sp. NPDC087314 TaxID=3364068 RepID=UPI00381710F1